MAITAKPQKQEASKSPVQAEPSEKDIRAIIGRGGTAAKDGNTATATTRQRIQLRLFQPTITEIDAAIQRLKREGKRHPTFSRHKWIEEAIDEKLVREEEATPR